MPLTCLVGVQALWLRPVEAAVDQSQRNQDHPPIVLLVPPTSLHLRPQGLSVVPTALLVNTVFGRLPVEAHNGDTIVRVVRRSPLSLLVPIPRYSTNQNLPPCLPRFSQDTQMSHDQKRRHLTSRFPLPRLLLPPHLTYLHTPHLHYLVLPPPVRLPTVYIFP